MTNVQIFESLNGCGPNERKNILKTFQKKSQSKNKSKKK